MEFVIVLLLIVLNGFFALAEIAVISTRKAKLQKAANEGNKNAERALELRNNPNRFLSTVQIGITFIGIFTGAFGGEPMARVLSQELKQIPLAASYSDPIALFLVVSFITYLSLVIGELVPKRLALIRPEKMAQRVARPMAILSFLASPLVSLLTISSDLLLRLLRIKPSNEPVVSEEEVKMMIREGTTAGVFNRAEKDIVERTFQLDDKQIISFMTPRQEIIWLDINSPFKTLRASIINHSHSHFPVCQGSLDKVLGVVRTEDLLTSFLTEEKIDLKKSLHKPIFVPETMGALKVLELFKKTGIHMALVIDEYGSMLGLLSLDDILAEIVGNVPDVNELGEQEITKKKDGTFLVDGLIAIGDFKAYFHINKLPGERSGAFHTIGGFVMAQIGRIPKAGDTFDFDSLHFEVLDMDGNRVDKVLVVPRTKPSL